MLAAYDASRKVAVTAPVLQAKIAWPYENFGAPGTVTERRDFAEINTTTVRFANGVRLVVRPSAKRKEQVMIGVRFGDGRLAMARDRNQP